MKKKSAFLFITLCLTACNWLPPSPNEPFYCKVNGKNFRPEKDTSPVGGIGSDPLRISWDKITGRLFITSRNSPEEISLVIVFPNKDIVIGEFKLENQKGFSSGVIIPDNDKIPNEQIVSSSGKVIISKIKGYEISGTFEFTCKSLNSGKEYKITKGCFNKLTYY
jgi:Family of unknown function (DUF6252)